MRDSVRGRPASRAWIALIFAAFSSAGAQEIVKGPWLQRVTPATIVVMWETDIPSPGRVEYGIDAPGDLVLEDPRPVAIHEIEIGGLAPDTTYRYRVSSDAAASGVHTFRTAPAGERSFRFAAYGDTRTQIERHAAIAARIIETRPEIVLHTGDCVNWGRTYAEWGPQFFDPAAALLAESPLFVSIGNHEYGGAERIWFYDFFSLPGNEQFYAFTYAGVRSIALDTVANIAPGSAQHEWLLEEFASPAYAAATWHVVFFHEPPFTSTSRHLDEVPAQTHLVPLFAPNGVDIVFNGHSHIYERYAHDGIPYIVTGGGGAPLYDLIEDVEPPIRLTGLKAYHFCIIDVDVPARTMTVSARDDDGLEFDRIVLSKGPRPPSAVACVQATADGAPAVLLRWTNEAAYDEIAVRRDGDLVATLAGGATSFLDAPPAEGPGFRTIAYEAEASIRALPWRGAAACAVAWYAPGVIAFQEGRLPDPSYDGARDAHVIESAPSNNAGSHHRIEEGEGREIAARFDLSAIPAGHRIASAMLHLFAELRRPDDPGSAPRRSGAARILSPWVEGTGESAAGRPARIGECTWEWAIMDLQAWRIAPPESLSSVYGDATGVWVTWDVTRMAQEWVDDPSENFGVRIVQDRAGDAEAGDPRGVIGFASREHPRDSIRPVLALDLDPPLGPTDLACAVAGDRVTLTWTSHADYDDITIRIDGEVAGAVAGETFEAGSQVPGLHLYEVAAHFGSLALPPIACVVRIVPRPVADLICAVAGEDAVRLAWRNDDRYRAIEVLRDGDRIAILSGEAREHTDDDAGGGVRSYAIRAWAGEVRSGLAAESAACRILVPVEPAADFICAPNGRDGIALSWRDADPYTRVVLYRDGMQIAVLPPGIESFTDEDVAPGRRMYLVQGWVGTTPAAVSACIANVPLHPPSGLICLGAGPRRATLAWSNADPYASIAILRDGVMVATLPGGATSHEDPAVPPGRHAYVAAGRLAGLEARTEACEVLVEGPASFRRGDANADGAIDLADAVSILDAIFAGREKPPCLDAFDANADLAIDIGDAVVLMAHLFVAGPPPAPPYPACGWLPARTGLGCEAFPPCAGS